MQSLPQSHKSEVDAKSHSLELNPQFISFIKTPLLTGDLLCLLENPTQSFFGERGDGESPRFFSNLGLCSGTAEALPLQ